LATGGDEALAITAINENGEFDPSSPALVGGTGVVNALSVVDVPTAIIKEDGVTTFGADWFKIVATASGSTADFDESTQQRLRSAVCSLTGAEAHNVVLLIKAGAANTVTLNIAFAVVVVDSTSDSDAAMATISASEFGSSFSSALAATGITVMGEPGVQAEKVQTAKESVSFHLIFGEPFVEEGVNPALSLAAVRQSPGKQAAGSSGTGIATMVGSIAGVLAGVLLSSVSSWPGGRSIPPSVVPPPPRPLMADELGVNTKLVASQHSRIAA
jgi:hypothetical protein